MKEHKFHPLGLRVFVEEVKDPLSNIGKDVIEGVIVEVPTLLSINCGLLSGFIMKDNAKLSKEEYEKIFGIKGFFRVGMKVRFKNNQEIIDSNNNIYNVPLELIRSYLVNE